MKNLQKIKNYLTKLDYKISVAESLSVGHIQARLGSISGSTAFFEGGLTAYSLEQKVKLLGIDKDHARKVDCVSERVAKEMAVGVCNLFNTEIAISSTGYAEPYKEMNIKKAFAYYCIWDNVRKKVILEGKVELEEESRISNQILLTNIIIYDLSKCLKKTLTSRFERQIILENTMLPSRYIDYLGLFASQD
jgi:nicotinamide-nucleotide amidase